MVSLQKPRPAPAACEPTLSHQRRTTVP